MNLDRLIKLLKLANHNSVDGEANSAARAACKILAEENYKWIEEANRNGGRAPRTAAADKMNGVSFGSNEITIKISKDDLYNNTRIHDLVTALENEIHRSKTYNDVKRSSEPWWKNPFTYDYKYGSWDYAPKEPPKPPPPKEQPRWTWTQQEENGNIKYKKVYNQKNRNCSVCGMTKFTANESNPYVCAGCKWKKYEDERKKT